jgi:hypothetical protein
VSCFAMDLALEHVHTSPSFQLYSQVLSLNIQPMSYLFSFYLKQDSTNFIFTNFIRRSLFNH